MCVLNRGELHKNVGGCGLLHGKGCTQLNCNQCDQHGMVGISNRIILIITVQEHFPLNNRITLPIIFEG